TRRSASTASLSAGRAASADAQRVRRQRCDCHSKTALTLVRGNDVLYHEDLQVRNPVQNQRLAKSIADAGWRAFLTILTYKAACAGRHVVAVNPPFTSQACSGCGGIVAKGLSVRWHSCPECGTVLHRGTTTPPETYTGAQQRLRGFAG